MSEIIISEQYKAAIELNQKIIITAQAAQQNLYDMCVMLKQMRDDKLYKELGYANFDDYCENEIGFSRRNARNYIAIIEKVNLDGKSISRIGMTKLSLLASLSESQQEEIQRIVDIEETSVRELKAEIASLKTKANEANELSQRIDDLNENCRRIAKQRDKAENKITQLETEIEELKNRQPEITPEDRDAQAIIRQLDRQLSEADQEYANNLERQRKEYQEEINRLNEQLEAQENEVRTTVETVEIPDMKEVFKAYYKNAIGAFNAILEFINSVSDDKSFYIQKADELVNKLENSLENMEV
ncbi:hypothetical protein [uncultured Ruminococcus sp.]|uniref:hypothetical protein n=1 Tax=uncultured Ruminococcus sp. TaxID=165186 RepID=UPI0025F28BDF|nr:hypothetical protein [uncultured Ruminococcus sp.]